MWTKPEAELRSACSVIHRLLDCQECGGIGYVVDNFKLVQRPCACRTDAEQFLAHLERGMDCE